MPDTAMFSSTEHNLASALFADAGNSSSYGYWRRLPRMESTSALRAQSTVRDYRHQVAAFAEMLRSHGFTEVESVVGRCDGETLRVCAVADSISLERMRQIYEMELEYLDSIAPLDAEVEVLRRWGAPVESIVELNASSVTIDVTTCADA